MSAALVDLRLGGEEIEVLSSSSSTSVAKRSRSSSTTTASASTPAIAKPKNSSGSNSNNPAGTALGVRRKNYRGQHHGSPMSGAKRNILQPKKSQSTSSPSGSGSVMTTGQSPALPVQTSAVPNEKENLKLRELLLSQLQTIQKQSEELLEKDKRLRELQKENESLKKRLFESPSSLQQQQQPARSKPASESKACITDIKDIGQPLVRRIAFTSADSAKKIPLSQPLFIETELPFFQLQGQDFLKREAEEIQTILRHGEVPAWRVAPVTPTYSMEGTENIEDETLQKRHSKPAAEEKRRKRWDIQRMREQREIERLKRRYEQANGHLPTTKKGGAGVSGGATPSSGKSGAGFQSPLPNLGGKPGVISPLVGGSGAVTPAVLSSDAPEDRDALLQIRGSFLPDPNLVTHVMVAESLPVCAFGCPVPTLGKKPFKLPWGMTQAKRSAKNLRQARKAGNSGKAED